MFGRINAKRIIWGTIFWKIMLGWDGDNLNKSKCGHIKNAEITIIK
jgi:hypothetical protein